MMGTCSSRGGASARMRPVTHAVIATFLLCLATIAYTHHMPEFGRFFAGADDFLPFYVQARMVGSAHLYEVEAGYREQERIVGFHIANSYNDRLPWQAVLMAPLGMLPYLPAAWLWAAINLACFTALVWLWLLPKDYVLWGSVFFPAAACIIVGQDTLILTLCIAGVATFAKRGHDVTAGLLLALCTAKPHLFLLIPIALIAHRRWKLVSSATLATVGLLAVGTVAIGSNWVPGLIRVIQMLGMSSGLDVVSRPSIFQFGISKATIAVALLLMAAFGVAIWHSRDLETGIAAAIFGSILIAPHTELYDLPLLLVALPALPVVRRAKWLRIALLTPVPYWALLRGSPWSAALPLLLFAITAVSMWPALPKGEQFDTGRGTAYRAATEIRDLQ
jgi:Glycosyltransferase family 87